MFERRWYARYPAVLEVEYTYDNALFTIESKTETRNISSDGASMPLNRALKPGKIIALKINLPRGNERISASGRIMWTRPLRRPGRDQNAGIKFIFIKEDDAVPLKECLRTWTI